MIQALEDSGLRGLGGAGFPAGRKWRIVRSEAGAAPDGGEHRRRRARHLQGPLAAWSATRTASSKGMLIAAWAVGIARVYVYLRDEYHGCRAMLEPNSRSLRAHPPYPGLPEIELRRGAGAYICGEESAMIESIEGKRGMPRLRPPYVAQVGLFGRPTLEHNFETLYWVREILRRAATGSPRQGRHGRKGLRSFSVSAASRARASSSRRPASRCKELIDEYCGGMVEGHGAFYAYLPGGASGGILPASMGDIPLDFDTLQPHGCFIGSAAVMVLSTRTPARRMPRATLMRFFEARVLRPVHALPQRHRQGVAR